MKDHPISPDGPRRPDLVVFDVNETLSDMSPLAVGFEEVGAPSLLAKTWFAELLRDGFALTVCGVAEPFARLATESLRLKLASQDLDRDLDEAVEHVLSGFAGLSLHPDVAEGLHALADLGVRLITLSNGSAQVAQTLLENAGVRRVRLCACRVRRRRGGCHAGRCASVGHQRGRARRARHSLDQPRRRQLPGVLHSAGPLCRIVAGTCPGDHLSSAAIYR